MHHKVSLNLVQGTQKWHWKFSKPKQFSSYGSKQSNVVGGGGNCRIQPTLASRTKDCPNPNNYPNPIVCKQDLNSLKNCLAYLNVNAIAEFLGQFIKLKDA